MDPAALTYTIYIRMHPTPLPFHSSSMSFISGCSFTALRDSHPTAARDTPESHISTSRPSRPLTPWHIPVRRPRLTPALHRIRTCFEHCTVRFPICIPHPRATVTAPGRAVLVHVPRVTQPVEPCMSRNSTNTHLTVHTAFAHTRAHVRPSRILSCSKSLICAG